MTRIVELPESGDRGGADDSRGRRFHDSGVSDSVVLAKSGPRRFS